MFIVAIVGAILMACGEGVLTPATPPSPPPPPIVSSVVVTPDTITLHSVEDTVRLTATARDQDGNVMSSVTTSWLSSDTLVATVGTGGLVTAEGSGATSITATVGGINGMAETIVDQVVTQIGFAAPPVDGLAGAFMVPPVVVSFQDAMGHVATNTTDEVTLQLATNPVGALLGGVTTVNAVAGVATFGQVFIDKTGSGFTLSATADPFPSVTSAGFGVENPVTSVMTVALETNDIIYDPVGGKLWASVPSSAGTRGNTLTSIDPVTGGVLSSVFIGSEPGRLAISDDGQFLYTGLNGAHKVRRFHIPSETPEIEFALGTDFGRPRRPDDIAVMTGQSHTVAVSLWMPGSPSFAGLAIYDDGVPRASQIRRGEQAASIDFGPVPSRLYAGSTSASPTRYYRMDVADFGVSVVEVSMDLIPGSFGSGGIQYDGGRVYSARGAAINAEQSTLAGTFALPSPSQVPAVRPEAAAGRVHFLTYWSGVAQITTYDAMTFIQKDAFSFPGISGIGDRLVRWGVDGFAFRTTDGTVILTRQIIP